MLLVCSSGMISSRIRQFYGTRNSPLTHRSNNRHREANAGDCCESICVRQSPFSVSTLNTKKLSRFNIRPVPIAICCRIRTNQNCDADDCRNNGNPPHSFLTRFILDGSVVLQVLEATRQEVTVRRQSRQRRLVSAPRMASSRRYSDVEARVACRLPVIRAAKRRAGSRAG